MTQRMKAIKSIRYRGVRLQPGEIFPVKSSDVQLLSVGQVAEIVDETEGKTTKRTYTRKASVTASSTKKPAAKATASKAKSTAKVSAKVTATKRRYNRRDMQAR